VRLHLNGKRLGMVMCACRLGNNGKCETGVLWSRLAQAKSEALSPK
jgi:hypothetical protein